jgi:hypothetical protein
MIFKIVAILLALWSSQAFADFYVAKSGNDSNLCTTPSSPCLTIQGAVAKAPLAAISSILVSRGRYTETVDIHHYRFVNVQGDCDDLSAVVVVAPAGTTAFLFQDYAIAAITCLTITGGGENTTGVYSRQSAIGDLDRIRWGALKVGIFVTEGAKVNCVGNGHQIFGDMIVFAQVSHLSALSLPCAVTFIGDRTFSGAFLVAGWKSVINATTFAWTGPPPIGQKYILLDSTLLAGGADLPGIGGVVQDNAIVK